jgi:catalase
MAREITPAELVAALEQDYPDHLNGTRPVHTNGLGVTGTFRASPVAKHYCIAEHFQGDEIPVKARFSNSSGSPERHDERPDVRGLAVKFQLAGDTATDLVTSNLNVFVVRTPQELLDMSRAMQPKHVVREKWYQKLWDQLHLRQTLPPPPKGVTADGTQGALVYAGAHAFAQLGVIGTGALGVPLSWARVKYHAVHTFRVTGDDGAKRWVRFSWQPVAGVCPAPGKPADWANLPHEFLTGELEQRLSAESARFVLKMTIGDETDAIDDPTVAWPVMRQMVMMGTLSIDAIAPDQHDGCDRLSFNPMRLTSGIEPSGDIMLHTRAEVYQWSAEQRDAIVCPLGHGAEVSA